MSCKPHGSSAPSSGCQGGNMPHFDSECKSWGITKERDNQYQCGGGNSLDHFTQQSATCDQFPWGGSCSGDANPNWWWAGSVGVTGEADMKVMLNRGQSMYVSMKCYKNFMNWKKGDDGVYLSTGGQNM